MIELIKKLIETPTVSGYEQRSADKIIHIAREYTGIPFDEETITSTGSVLLCRKAKSKGKRKVVLDAHIDTIGFVVTEFCGEGFVKVASAGGIDSNILPACEIMLYGKENLRGFFTSVPPHLSKSDKLPKIDEMLVDTGLDDEALKSIIEIGTPASFYAPVIPLQNNRIASHSLDDKLCVAAVLETLKIMSSDELYETDVYAYFSAGEERNSLGANLLAETVDADACIVLDVNFGKSEGLKDSQCITLDKGPGLSISSTTSRKLTDFMYTCTQSAGLSCQRIVEMTDTGTNAQSLGRMGNGIATAVLSLPLRYMHTSVETASLNDVENCAKVLREFLLCYDKAPVCIPVHLVKGG